MSRSVTPDSYFFELEGRSIQEELAHLYQNIGRKEKRIMFLEKRMKDMDQEKIDLQSKIDKIDEYIAKKDKEIGGLEDRLRALSEEKTLGKRKFKDWDKLLAQREQFVARKRQIPFRIIESLELRFNEHCIRERNAVKGLNPTKGQDFKRQVYGKVYRFFKVRQPRHMSAINCICQKHLFKIVVEDALVGEQILRYRLIKGNTRLLPLANLRVAGFSPFTRKRTGAQVRGGSAANAKVLAQARELVSDMRNAEVYLPQELIEYEKKYRKLINFVFQNHLIVSCMDVGKVICDAFKVPCVTLDGELVAEGVLSGGYQDDRVLLLERAKVFIGLQSSIAKLDEELQVEQAEKQKVKSLRKEIEQVSQNLRMLREIKRSQQDNRKQVIRMSKIQLDESVAKEILQMQRLIEKYQKQSGKLEEKLRRIHATVAKKIQNDKNMDTQKIIAETREQIAELRSELEYEQNQQVEAEEMAINFGQERERLQTKLLALKDELEMDKRQVRHETARQVELLTEAEKMKEGLRSENDKRRQAERERRGWVEEKRLAESEVAACREEKSEVERAVGKLVAHVRKLKSKMRRRKKVEFSQLETEKIDQLEQSMEFLANVSLDGDEQDLLGKQDRIEAKVKDLEEKVACLRRVVRFEAEDLLEKLEKDVDFIGQHKGIIYGDLESIRSNIHGLNEKKHFAVLKCFKKVNHYLKTIFSSLVPGARAKMVLRNYHAPSDDCQAALDGLQSSQFGPEESESGHSLWGRLLYDI